MKILNYRTVAVIYPYLSLEGMVELDNGDIVYTNISVNDKGQRIDDWSDSNWTYSKPLTELGEDPEEFTYDLSSDECEEICRILASIWNHAPVFHNDKKWKDVV